MDKKLKRAIKFELENIRRLVNEAKELHEKIGDAPDPIETRAAGSILHDFYCGVEKIFERIAVNIDKNLLVVETGMLIFSFRWLTRWMM